MSQITLRNARLLAEDHFTALTTLHISNGRITATGDEAADGSAGEDIDVDGQFVMPGFIESHGHPSMYGRTLLQVDVRPDVVDSIAGIQTAIREAASSTEPGGWIRGAGWDETYLADDRVPTREDLDAAAPDHPVVLTRTCRHMLLVNSKALEVCGVDEDTPDPAGGRLVKDGSGRLTGLCQEKAMDLITVPDYEPDELSGGFARAQQQFLDWGITTVHDMSTSRTDLRLYTELADSRQLSIRLRPWLWALTQMGYDGILDAALAAGVTSGLGDDWMRIQGAKFVLDGGVGGKTAALCCPYEHSDETGILYIDDETLTGHLREAVAGGLRLAIHSIGDAAIAQARRALKNIGDDEAVRTRRTRIEHCTLPADEDLDFLAEWNIIACSSVGFIYHLGDSYLKVLGRDRMPRVYPHRSFIDRGIIAPGNSDVPVTNGNPWEGIYGAVTRTTKTGQVLDAEQNITLAEAIRAYTSDAAYTSFEEDTLGTLAPGAHADFQLYDRNPFDLNPEEWLDLTPSAVYVAGEKQPLSREHP
ncbi:amidohydrolase [Brevibacterium sp. UBA7493]|uniref:amidohydrolase n=1 Tax=Brevibacterium sp. UBA7493 TaxID=1946121 RepID=UPI00257E9B82|nr:amidohydrolase [Brevibacterium sp. UBA7493]